MIQISNDITEHWLWNDALKLKWWLDLLIMAKPTETKMRIGGEIVTLEKGEILVSLTFLMERWRYLSNKGKILTPSKHTIIDFLKRLEDSGMIKQSTTTTPNHNTTITPLETAVFKVVYDGCEVEQETTTAPNHSTTLKTTETDNTEPTKVAKKEKFVKPTIEEIIDFCNLKNLKIDVEYFFDFYENKNWYVGKNKMKDWRLAANNWARRNKQYGENRQVDNNGTTREQRETELLNYISAKYGVTGGH